MPSIRTLELHGTPYEMGFQHGSAFADLIREVTANRLALCQNPHWTGQILPFSEIMALAESSLSAHAAYAPHLMEELQGIADATRLSLAELIILNGFTDFVDAIYNTHPLPIELAVSTHNCTTYAAASRQTHYGYPFIGQNWDMDTLMMPYVTLLKGTPQHRPSFFAFTLTGCIGMIGMNEAGIAVCINNLSDAHGQPKVTWNFVIRKILEQTTLEDALACITEAELGGGHNYLLMDRNGHGYNVEAMSGGCYVEPLQDYLAHTNQCLHTETSHFERPLTPEEVEDSAVRRHRALSYLQKYPLTLQDLMDLSRDCSDGVNSVCVNRVDWGISTCGAVIMSPATHEMWALSGLPTENEYTRFVL